MPVSPGDEELIRRFHQAFVAADETELANALAPDATWHVPGSERFGGPHEGQEAVLAHLLWFSRTEHASLCPWSEDSLDIAVGGSHLVLIDRMVARREGREMASEQAWVIELRGGRIWRVTQHVTDVAAFDEFWS